MNQINDGGPAFPTHGTRDVMDDEARNGWREVPVSHGGMTLRDYFAAKAMQAEIITTASDATPEAALLLVQQAERNKRSPVAQIAANAYEMADAMLNARDRR